MRSARFRRAYEVRVLLDTHVWLRAALEPERLGERARDALADRSNALFVSIASIWEMTIKASLKKLDLRPDAEAFVRKYLPKSGSELLDLSLDHIFALRSLPDHHGDPFDRILVAQALTEGMTIVTADPRVIAYPVAALDARV